MIDAFQRANNSKPFHNFNSISVAKLIVLVDLISDIVYWDETPIKSHDRRTEDRFIDESSAPFRF